MPVTQENRYLSVTTPLGADKLLLKSFHGEEQISGLFRFTLEMESEDPALDFSAIVGKSVTITVQLADDTRRYLNGIVGRFVQAGGDPTFTTYYAEIHPTLWLLTQTRNCRIFQEMSTMDIVEAILGEHGVSFRSSLQETYEAREYCVQYDESDFDFASRLLEDEGIFYFFEHADGQHTLVFGDAATAFPACPGAATVEYGTWGQWIQQNVVTRCTLEEAVIPGAAALDDFSFEIPTTDLIANVDSTLAQDGAKRRIYEYPGGFLVKAKGDARAGVRIEEHEAPKVVLRGESYSRPFVTGHKFTLAKHYREDANAEYVLRRVVHAATWEGYTNAFEAFPSPVAYRPPRTTRRPRIPGTQTALVVGKSGEEIWTDEYGRVKVQFHWDQEGQNDENSSCWIRVAHGWAGKSWGQIFIPRIGQEVVVSFLEGDPDRPLITGSVYNAETTVPYALPDEQTKSTIMSDSSKGGGGYNELRFEDKKDSEEVYFQAEKDYNAVVKNNETRTIGLEKKDAGDQTIEIHNNRTVTINEGNETFTVKKGDRTMKVETGKEIYEVKGTREVTVTGDETHNDKANFTQNVDKNHTLKVKGDLTIDVTGKITIKSGGDTLVDAGQNLTTKSGMNTKNEAGMNFDNKAGVNMTNDAGVMLTNKAAASQTVDGGGMLTLKGGMVKIN